MPTRPELSIMKSVVDAPVLEVEPIAKRVVSTEVEATWSERSANGEEEAIPTAPVVEAKVITWTGVRAWFII